MALKTQHRYQLFLFSGAASCTAEICTVPIDVVKIRMQLQGELGAKRVYASSLSAFPHIIREEGVFALWKGDCVHIRLVADAARKLPYPSISRRATRAAAPSYIRKPTHRPV